MTDPKKEGILALLTEEQIDIIKQILADLFSLDVITAKGNITMKLSLGNSILDMASGDDRRITILARTVIQFGGDQSVLIPTDDGTPGGSISLNQQIWELHREQVTSAREKRKDDLNTVREVITLIADFVDVPRKNVLQVLASLRPQPPSTTSG